MFLYFLDINFSAIFLANFLNAKNTIPLVEKDSRLGWEPSMEYVTDKKMLEWKIRQVQFVLGTFDATDEQPVIDEQVPVAVDIIKNFCFIGLARTMNDCNRKNPPAK